MNRSVLYRVFAAALVLGVAVPAATQQRHSTEWRTKPAESRFAAVNRVEAAREFALYARCVASNRYERARALVLAPYASEEQSRAASQIVVAHRDPCFRASWDEFRFRFEGSALAGGLAQALVLMQYADLPTVIAARSADPVAEAATVPQLHAAEIFGRCIAQRDPAAVLALISSVAGTGDEEAAIASLRDDLPECLAAGSRLAINAAFLRNVTAIAAYRLAQQIQPRGRAGGEGGQ